MSIIQLNQNSYSIPFVGFQAPYNIKSLKSHIQKSLKDTSHLKPWYLSTLSNIILIRPTCIMEDTAEESLIPKAMFTLLALLLNSDFLLRSDLIFFMLHIHNYKWHVTNCPLKWHACAHCTHIAFHRLHKQVPNVIQSQGQAETNPINSKQEYQRSGRDTNQKQRQRSSNQENCTLTNCLPLNDNTNNTSQRKWGPVTVTA